MMIEEGTSERVMRSPMIFLVPFLQFTAVILIGTDSQIPSVAGWWVRCCVYRARGDPRLIVL